jgi:hypothetical protein
MGSARSLTRVFTAVVLAVFVGGCPSIPISYYDATTYTQLTNLKAETTSLIESFDQKPFLQNEAKIEATTLSLRKAYEYEKGKGAPNSDTATQFDLIAKLYADIVVEYRDLGPNRLGANYFQEAAKALGQAFDVAIKTENVKNKDKR